MKKITVITFGLIGTILGLVFSSTKLHAYEIDTTTSLYWAEQYGHEISIYAPDINNSAPRFNFFNFIEVWDTYYTLDTKTAIITFQPLETVIRISSFTYSGNIDQIVIISNQLNGYIHIDFLYNGSYMAFFASYTYSPLPTDYFTVNNTINTGYNDGYNDGFIDGNKTGIYDVYFDGFGGFINPDTNEPYDYTYSFPYGQGYNAGLEATNDYSLTGMLFQIFGGLGALLSIELLPNITIGAIVAVPLVFGIIYFILGKRSGDK